MNADLNDDRETPADHEATVTRDRILQLLRLLAKEVAHHLHESPSLPTELRQNPNLGRPKATDT